MSVYTHAKQLSVGSGARHCHDSRRLDFSSCCVPIVLASGGILACSGKKG